MKICEEKGCSSIAFPALGAGNLYYPSLVVAKVMINAVHNYFQANRATASIKQVKFVIFVNETYNKFESYLSKLSGDLPQLLCPTAASYISLHNSEPLNAMSPPSESLLETFRAGDTIVEVIYDDISSDDSDAIVNPTQSDLQPLTGEVSNAMSEKAGSIMQQNCQIYIKKHKQLEEGKVFVTQATGKLRCKVVFHLITPKTKRELSEAVTSCLHEAERKGFRSLAIPAIGTEEMTLTFTPNIVAQLMCEAIIQFRQTFPMFLKQIRIVLHHESSYQIFVQKFIHISNEYTACFEPNTFVQCRHVKSTAPTEFTGEKIITKPVMHSCLQVPSIQIKVYAMSQEAVLKTEDSLLGIIHEQFESFSVNNPVISTLKPQQVSQLMQKAAEFHLVIEVERELSQIQIRGRKDHMQLLKTIIFEMLHEIDKKTIETLATEKEAKLKRETELQLEKKEAQLRKEASDKEAKLKKEAEIKLQENEERLKREANENEAWLAREAEFKLQAKEAQLKREASEKEINLKRAAAVELQEKELVLKREASEKEAQLKREAKMQLEEKEAKLKREANEKETRLKKKASEKEAQLKREASEKEAQLKREAKMQLEEKEVKLKREANEKEARLKKEASEKEAQLKREAKMQLEEKEAKLKRKANEKEAQLKKEASEKEERLKREAKLQLEEKEARLKREATKKEVQLKKEAALQKEVKWEYLVNDNIYEDYDLDINYKIEEAYKLYKTQNNPVVFTYTKQSQEYKIYFDRNPIQQENSSNKTLINLRRIDIKEMINMARRGENLIINVQ